MTLRLADEQAAALELIARGDDQNLTDAVRTAIDKHIADRRSDKDFMSRLKDRHERERELFDRLAK